MALPTERVPALGLEPIPGIKLCELGRGHLRDKAGSIRRAVDGRIVNCDRNTVRRETHVDVDHHRGRSSDQSGAAFPGNDGVLGIETIATAMGNHERLAGHEWVGSVRRRRRRNYAH